MLWIKSSISVCVQENTNEKYYCYLQKKSKGLNIKKEYRLCKLEKELGNEQSLEVSLNPSEEMLYITTCMVLSL